MVALSAADVDSPNADSRVLQLEITAEPNGTGWIFFRSERGMLYQLQASSLSEPSEWMPASDVFVARGDLTQYKVSLAPGTYFYRVAKLGASGIEKTAVPILAAPDLAKPVPEALAKRQILSSDRIVSAMSLAEPQALTLTPLLLDGDDGSGPSDWVAKVEWILKHSPLIAHPLDGSFTK